MRRWGEKANRSKDTHFSPSPHLPPPLFIESSAKKCKSFIRPLYPHSLLDYATQRSLSVPLSLSVAALALEFQ